MSEAPTDPRELAESAVRGELRSWITTQAERQTGLGLDGSLKSLVPPPSVQGMQTLGVQSLDLPALNPESLGPEDAQTFRIWFDEGGDYSAAVVEKLVQSMRWFRHPVMFTCCGNRSRISHGVSVHSDDSLAMQNLLKGAFPAVQVEAEVLHAVSKATRRLETAGFAYRSIKPPMPYWGVFEEGGLDFATVYATMADVDDESLCIHQVVIAALPDAYTSLIQTMVNAQAVASERGMLQYSPALSKNQQKDAQPKIQGPLFASAVRLAVITGSDADPDAIMGSLLLGIAAVRFSGRPLALIDQDDLLTAEVAPSDIGESFITGATHHHGFIASPAELALFLRFPSKADLGQKEYRLDRQPLCVGGMDGEAGPLIGHERVWGKELRVPWPDRIRTHSMLATGSAGSGKSHGVSLMLADQWNTHPDESGLLVDPHRTALDRIITELTEERCDSVIMPDHASTDMVFASPPIECDDPDLLDAATDNVLTQICSLFPRRDLGFNIVTGMSNIIRTILSCKELSLIDARRLAGCGARDHEFREQVCSQLDDELLIDYWLKDFASLDKASMMRIRSRFDSILRHSRLKPFFANKIRKISPADIIREGKLSFVDTCPHLLGSGFANILGSVHTTSFQSAAPSCGGREAGGHVCTIVLDEFGNYSNPRTLPHALRTLRKFDVSQVLITQNIDALSDEVKSALGNIGTHLAFRQGWSDAQQYFKIFGGVIPVERLMNQGVGHAYASISSRLAVVRCPPPALPIDRERIEAIRERTRRDFCVPIKEFRERMIEEYSTPLEDMKALDLI